MIFRASLDVHGDKRFHVPVDGTPKELEYIVVPGRTDRIKGRGRLRGIELMTREEYERIELLYRSREQALEEASDAYPLEEEASANAGI